MTQSQTALIELPSEAGRSSHGDNSGRCRPKALAHESLSARDYIRSAKRRRVTLTIAAAGCHATADVLPARLPAL